MTAQASQLADRPHVVIATPGRLADHIRSSPKEMGQVFRKCKFLVLDEADRLFSESYAKDLAVIMDVLPPPAERQTLLFTATVTPHIRTLAEKPPSKGRKPVFIHELDSQEIAIPEKLDQRFLLVPGNVRETYLFALLSHRDYKKSTCIIFVNTIYMAALLSRLLARLGIKNSALYSTLPQSERISSLEKFRAGAVRVLVCTDVASRGLDIPEVDLVINFDIPRYPDDYIHRVGRTARAGRDGMSISFVSANDVKLIEAIEERVGSKMEECTEIRDDTIVEILKTVSEAKRKVALELPDKDEIKKRKRNYQAIS